MYITRGLSDILEGSKYCKGEHSSIEGIGVLKVEDQYHEDNWASLIE
jgi:hypothetical protein